MHDGANEFLKKEEEEVKEEYSVLLLSACTYKNIGRRNRKRKGREEKRRERRRKNTKKNQSREKGGREKERNGGKITLRRPFSEHAIKPNRTD